MIFQTVMTRLQQVVAAKLVVNDVNRKEGGYAMDLWSRMLLPWLSIRLPASGDVLMNYNPWTNWGLSNYDAGNPEMEQEIFANVALPGKQLGKLSEAVKALIALAQEAHPELATEDLQQPAAFREFLELADKISLRKEELKGTVEGNAKSALLRLKQSDREAYNRLIESER